jgi:hypothetical protein
MKSIEEWRGPRDPVVLDPAAMDLEVKPARRANDGCSGCSFARQMADVCGKAAARASELGLPDCDAGYIYIAIERLQKDIFNNRAA